MQATLLYPASYTHPSIVSVLNTTTTDRKAASSCHGKVSVDLGAPGTDILSCDYCGRHVKKTGTSMATPHVAGALAVLADYTGTDDISVLRTLLLENVDKVPGLGRYCATGGRLNLHKALAAAKNHRQRTRTPKRPSPIPQIPEVKRRRKTVGAAIWVVRVARLGFSWWV